MRKVFFMLFSMDLGGTERAFLSFINRSVYSNAEIHLGLWKVQGELINELPKNVIVHDIGKNIWNDIESSPKRLIINKLKRLKFYTAYKLFISYYNYKRTGDKIPYYSYLLRKVVCLETVFEEAHAFAGPASVLDFYIINKIKSRQKFGWIHFDISKIYIDFSFIRKVYGSYDRIYIVSRYAKEKFKLVFPEFESKLEVCYNEVDSKQILCQSQGAETYKDDFSGYRLLTVGRITEQKAQDLAIDVLKILKEKGFNIRWYFVGSGDMEMLCRDKAKKYGLSESAIFLGKYLNPYGFMRDCDIYVQPSRYEGYSVAILEAKCFSKPIIVTNFSGATEQLTDKTLHRIVGEDEWEIADAIAECISKLQKKC